MKTGIVSGCHEQDNIRRFQRIPLLNGRGQVVAVLHRAFEDTNLISAVRLPNLQLSNVDK